MKIRLPQRLSAALLGLSLAGAVSNADTTNLVSLTTFESGEGLRYNYPYDYNWGFTWPGTTRTFFVDAEPPDYTNNFGHFSFDNSPVAPFFPDSAAGYGFGFGGGLNWDFDTTKFVGTNREEYIVEFDCKVEGLSNTVTSASGEFQVKFEAPDDTLSPPDSNTDPDVLVQFNHGFSASSNWTHYVFTFDEANVDGNGNWAQFVQFRSVANNVNFGCNWHQPDPQFGFDADNQVWVDNVVIHAIDRAPVVPLPTVPFTILDWNLDDKALWWGSGGWAWSELAPNYVPTGTYSITAAGQGVGGSNGWVLTMDNSTLAPPHTPAWAGIGMNGGGPGVDYSLFNTSDLASYRVSFDCRAEGLAPGKTSTICRHQLFLRAPDDTIQPPDGNTDSDTVLQLDFDVPAGTNWQTVSYLFSKGTIGSGSKANFTNYVNLINEPMAQFQIENPHSAADWEFDANNVLVIDNYKLERLVVGCPPLSVAPSGSNVILSWAPLNTLGHAKVQRAANITGPYDDVPGATNSPVTLPATNATGFFRTKWVPPSP